MIIIRKNPNPSGSYPAPQTVDMEAVPNGYAVIADTVDMAAFYDHNGFVTLTIEAVEHTRQVERMVTVEKARQVEKVRMVEKTREVEVTGVDENGEEQTTLVPETYYEEEVYTDDETYYEDEVQAEDEIYTIDTMTAYAPNVEAWEAWKASLPEPKEPEPTWQDQIEAQVTYTAMMTDTLLEE